MQRFLSTSLGSAGIVILSGLSTALAGESSLAPDQRKDPARMNCGAQIECITPDGHAGQVSRLTEHDPAAIALIMEDDTVTCLLQEGETNFVIELPRNAVPDRFTFLNENAAAHGELKIAVANQRLAADSPDWIQVEGVVPFARKRLFGVSLLGIEAKFVRVSFHVEKQPGMAARDGSADTTREASSDRASQSTHVALRFQNSDLDNALNSRLAALHSRGSTLLLSANSPSVAPLPQISRD
jgi:hypothetical protein